MYYHFFVVKSIEIFICTMFLVNILPTRIEKKYLELFIESITLYVSAMCMYCI